MSSKPSIPSWQRAQETPPTPPTPPEEPEPLSDPEPEPSPAPGADESTKQEPQEMEAESPSLVEQASRFLEDPAIRDAPREKKVAFLQSKGVEADEIERLLEPKTAENASPAIPEADERAWSTFLAQPVQKPPLITTQRLLNTAYITSGIVATIYGLSKYIIAPIKQDLTDSRHDFSVHTQEKLDEFNQRLADLASVDPASKAKSVYSDAGDDISEADSDPTELYHRDYGTQTTPSLSRRPSLASNAEEEPVVKAHENRMKIITSHLREIEATKSNNVASSDSLQTKLSDLTTYLSDMSYQSQFSNMGGVYGTSYGLPKKDGRDDYMEVLKNDIRAVKGVFLNFAKKLPFGRSKSPAKSEDDGSLTSLLNPEQCADLTFLIATITATMRKSLLDTFTAEEAPIDEKATKSEAEALAAASTNIEQADVEKEDKLKKERGKREQDARKELTKPEVQELKKAMLAYFDEWRGRVIIRVGEIVNTREEAKTQTQGAKMQDVEKKVKSSETGMTSINSTEDKGEDENTALRELHPPTETTLTSLEQEKRMLVLHSLILILLSLETYSAHSRILLLHLTSSLNLNLSVLKKDEDIIAQGLLEAASQQLSADAETKKAAASSSTSRKWKVGLAGVAGAALIGVTGGLAAPFLAAGIGTVMGGLGLGATAAAGCLGTLASSSVLVGGLFGAYGAKMTSKAMDDYARQVEDFGFIPIHHFHRPRKLQKEFRRLRVSIAISGWLTCKEDVVVPWRYLEPSIEGFALRWELEALLKLGNSMDTVVKSAAWGYAKGQVIKHTVFGALAAGLWPLGLLKISSILDNPFSVAKYRADKAGQVLADALINKVQGERPVTLIGYSLGARLIYSCLQTLAQRHAFGLIENVVLLGAPCPSDAADWRKIRSVVSGRVVNVFSTNDYILGFLYRTSSIQLGVAGLQPVPNIHGIQNVDVSEMVAGHLAYRYLTGSILKKIGFEDIDVEEVELEEKEMKAMAEKEKKERESKESEKGKKSEDEEKKDLEREVEKRNEQSVMGWAAEQMGGVGTVWSSGRKERTEAEKMVELEKKAKMDNEMARAGA
ncbi:DUF726-domain-containing protein [Massarina eburnea CBS 473.64]|uniref:DUF726-domain-containing protein n=1 Tax=Massarina eburnea CBS 473.64 TaxID=1395130 RepID=A0A6A6RW88_9PLEO|nr:DUF726-domain-containing protein [Massarina eburnea CBS 473.64]